MPADPLTADGGWWSDLDGEVLRQLETRRAASVEELSSKLGMPPAAVTSLLCMLAAEGKIRIRVVELADRRSPLS